MSSPVTLAGPRGKPTPIFRGEKRKSLIAEVMDELSDWRLSPFENEGPVTAGLRSGLCLEGYGWRRSDAEAAGIVQEGLKLLGAERPSLLEGQKYYTTSPDFCCNCGGPIDDDDMTRCQRFCSPECARVAIQKSQWNVRKGNNAVIQSAYWLIRRKERPPRECDTCRKPFHPTRTNTRFCSPKCAQAARIVLQPETSCAWCDVVFRPNRKGGVFCSKACAMKARLKRRLEAEPDRPCAWCRSQFKPRSVQQRFCSTRCSELNAYARARMIKASRKQAAEIIYLTPAVFDGWFKEAA
jgi:hypothetical protein